MKSLRFIIALLLITATHSFADLVPDPAAKSIGAVDWQTINLYQRLVGSSWTYAWHGATGELTFAQGGAINAGMWPGATWRITSPNTIAIKHPKYGEMPVRFTSEFKKFIARDWNGGEGVGTCRNPNAKVSK
jgi:hypothetical protein